MYLNIFVKSLMTRRENITRKLLILLKISSLMVMLTSILIAYNECYSEWDYAPFSRNRGIFPRRKHQTRSFTLDG